MHALSRRWLTLAGALGLVAAVALGVKVGGGDWPMAIDQTVWRVTGSDRFWSLLDGPTFGRARSLASDLAALCTPVVTVAVGTGFALFHGWTGRWRPAVFFGVTPLAVLVLNDVILKRLFDRTLRGELAYPSGHTAAALCGIGILGVAVYRWGGWRRLAATIALWSVPFAGFVLHFMSRRYHYFSDLVGGAAVGLGVTLLAAAWLLAEGGARPTGG